MDRRVLLAVVLCLLTVIGWGFLQSALRGNAPQTPPTTPATPAPGAGMDGAGNPANPPGVQPPAVPGGNPVPGAPAPPAAPPAPTAPPPIQKAEEEEKFPVEMPPSSEWLRVGFTNRGGAIRYVTLKDSYEFPDKKQNLDLILPADRDLLTGDLSLDDADSDRLRTLGWTRDHAAEAASPELDVVFTFDTTRGFRLMKRFVLPTTANRFDCDLIVSATPLAGGAGGQDVAIRLLGVAGVIREPQDIGAYAQGMSQNEGLVSHVLGEGDDLQYTPWKIDSSSLSPVHYAARNFRILGVQTQYFAAVLFADGDAKSPRVKRLFAGGAAPERLQTLGESLVTFFEAERGRPLAGDQLLTDRIEHAGKQGWLQAWAEFDLKVSGGAAAPESAVFHLYVGPTSRHVFAEDRYTVLKPLITYSISPDFLASFLLTIFDFFYWILGSAGVAVILMTLVVRAAMMPLSVKNQLSMRRHGRKIAKLKPKLEVLKKKWANDKRRYQEEQMKLYREHGIGFPMGCLMIFVQIPIFMALFSSLRVDFDIHHQSFLWIRDLTGPDRLVDFGTNIIGGFPFPLGGIRGINLLPLLSVVLSIYQQKMMPKPTDPQQEQQMKMMKWMPVMFAVLLYNYTAGLSLYMIFSSIIAILESKWVKHHDAIEQAAA